MRYLWKQKAYLFTQKQNKNILREKKSRLKNR
jgi:hypothetical protein